MTTFVNARLLTDDAIQDLCGSVTHERSKVQIQHDQQQQDLQECDDRLMALAEERDRRIFQHGLSWNNVLPIRSPVTTEAKQAWIEWCANCGLMSGKQDLNIKQWVIECAVDLLEDDDHFLRQQKAVQEALPSIAAQNDPWGTLIKRVDLTLDYQAEEHVQFFIGQAQPDLVYIYRQRHHSTDRMAFDGWPSVWKAVQTYLWWIGEEDRTSEQLHLISEGPMLLVGGKAYHWECE